MPCSEERGQLHGIPRRCSNCQGKGMVAVADTTGECIDWDLCPVCRGDDDA